MQFEYSHKYKVFISKLERIERKFTLLMTKESQNSLWVLIVKKLSIFNIVYVIESLHQLIIYLSYLL